MNSDELHELAVEVVEEVLEVVEIIDAKMDSRFKRPSKPEINYLLSTITNLCTTVLELSGSGSRYEKLIALKDKEIHELTQQNLKLAIEKEQLKADAAN